MQQQTAERIFMTSRQPQTGPIQTDIAARENHVIGSGPRIAPLSGKEVDPASLKLVNDVRAGAGAPPVAADNVPEYMLIAMKHPEIFASQMVMGTALYNGRIPPRERELAILRIAWLTQSPYEWGQHVAIAQRVGMNLDEVHRAREGSSAAGWNAHEAAILRGVEELLADYALSDTTWDILAHSWDEAQLLEFPMMVGQYIATALVQNSVRIPMESGNPGLSAG
jgi:alkylhydroperoxidase family enzyme